jgi:MFS family permease
MGWLSILASQRCRRTHLVYIKISLPMIHLTNILQRAKLSDIWGRKLILLVSVAWFFVSSIICATAPSMSVLIAGRALQGVGGGALIQVTIITISDLFSMRLRTLFIGLMEFMWALAGGIGPIVGGVFSESVSWRCEYVSMGTGDKAN